DIPASTKAAAPLCEPVLQDGIPKLAPSSSACSGHRPLAAFQLVVRRISRACSSPYIFGDQRGCGARPGERAQGGGTRSGSL
ncbi:unnamed protein product, partial [Urochloa humidicola]